MAAVYRNTTLGVCLIEALQEMQQQQKINDEKLIKKILFQFDKSMMEVLESKSLSKCVMKVRHTLAHIFIYCHPLLRKSLTKSTTNTLVVYF
jgi:hypothetical protein